MCMCVQCLHVEMPHTVSAKFVCACAHALFEHDKNLAGAGNKACILLLQSIALTKKHVLHW